MTSNPQNQRGYILEIIKERFGKTPLWTKIEGELAVKCASLPDIITEERRAEFINGLQEIKKYLIEKGIGKEELGFIDEEIERYESTQQLTLNTREDSELTNVTILAYAAQANNTEGITAIHLKLNYEQLVKLSNGVYRETGLMKFYISREKRLVGKVVAEIYENPVKMVVATLCEHRAMEEGIRTKRLFLFGEKFDQKKWTVIRNIKNSFKVYKFITRDEEEYMVLSVEDLLMGDYTITGVSKEVDDLKILSESAKIPTKLTYLFCQQAKSKVNKYKTREDYIAALETFDISKEHLFDFPFTIIKGDYQIIPKHPEWFKKLIWAWYTHEQKGLFNKYPMHLMVVGPKASGKSTLLNSLHQRSEEMREVFSGSNSTLKNLVPSFRNVPPKAGFLAESNRFAFCDEFLRCIVQNRNDNADRDEKVAMMNDLLEHQRREVGSGNGKISVNMTARVLAATNPVRGINCVEDMTRILDESFLSRWLIYYQTEKCYHVKMIRNSVDEDLPKLEYTIPVSDFLGLLDYLQSFSATYDMKRVVKILEESKKVLSTNLLMHYDARHRHHIECLIDGVIKTRCFFERDLTFKATEEDYLTLKDIWGSIINSWTGAIDLKQIDIYDRIHYLPEASQYLYWQIVEAKRPVSRSEVKEMAMKGMTAIEYITTYMILKENELIIEGDDGLVRTHHFNQVEDIGQ